jgi:hypothetical protein
MTSPEKSSILRASMPKSAGGLGWCTDKTGKPVTVFADASDPDYRVILAQIRACKERRKTVGTTEHRSPRAMTGYIYWMKRYGILPPAFDIAKDSFDPYAIDEKYWESFWWKPVEN